MIPIRRCAIDSRLILGAAAAWLAFAWLVHGWVEGGVGRTWVLLTCWLA